MNPLLLVAGWPFAGLLALDSARVEVSGAAWIRGLVVESDEQRGVLVLESGDATSPLATDAATGFFGVDGYPIARGGIRVGDTVETAQEKAGGESVTTTVRILRRARA